jgi:hypothetical protein
MLDNTGVWMQGMVARYTGKAIQVKYSIRA